MVLVNRTCTWLKSFLIEAPIRIIASVKANRQKWAFEPDIFLIFFFFFLNYWPTFEVIWNGADSFTYRLAGFFFFDKVYSAVVFSNIFFFFFAWGSDRKFWLWEHQCGKLRSARVTCQPVRHHSFWLSQLIFLGYMSGRRSSRRRGYDSSDSSSEDFDRSHHPRSGYGIQWMDLLNYFFFSWAWKILFL